MADLRQQRRIEQLDGDREALEHIARALEGRVLPLAAGAAPGAPEVTTSLEAQTLTPHSVKLLLEAMPAAIAVLAGRRLIDANAAFSYAFGYRSLTDLINAGGLEAILPQGFASLVSDTGAGRSAPVDALTRSRRKLKVAFAMSVLDDEADLKLLRLIDQKRLDEEGLPTPAELDAQAASRRLDFLAKVSHEVRTPLNSILGFTELMLQERFGPIGNARYTGYVEDIHQSGL